MNNWDSRMKIIHQKTYTSYRPVSLCCKQCHQKLCNYDPALEIIIVEKALKSHQCNYEKTH